VETKETRTEKAEEIGTTGKNIASTYTINRCNAVAKVSKNVFIINLWME